MTEVRVDKALLTDVITKNAAVLLELRRKIDAAILDCLVTHGGVEMEHALIVQAADQLHAMTGKGGSSRAKGEREIIRLIEAFDNTRDDPFGPWPLSKFLMEHKP